MKTSYPIPGTSLPRASLPRTSLLALAAMLAVPASAAELGAESDGTSASQPVEDVEVDDDASDDIIVTAPQVDRRRVDIPQTPVAVLDEDEILSIGASSLVELLEELAPQTGSGRGRGSGGRPAILVNGQRVSGFRELRNYPPEALASVEILPEEAAIRFGFRPDQRVINFILKERYASKGIELEYGVPGDGGYHTSEIEASLLSISGPNRFNLAFEAEDSSMLTEGERGVSSYGFDPVFGDANPADFQSLVADTRDLSLNGAWTRGLGEDGGDGSLTVNGTITRSDSLSLRGPDTALLNDASGAAAQRVLVSEALGRGARVRDSRSAGFEVGTTFNKRIADWDLTVTGRWTHDDTVSRSTAATDVSALQSAVLAGQIGIDAPVDDLLAFVPDQRSNASYSNTEDATSLATLTGRPLWLPAGQLAVTVQAGFDWSNIDSRSTDNPGLATDLTRGDANGGFTLGIPLTSRRDDVLAAIGDITLDLSGGVNDLSDFGTLYNWSAGLNWSPVENLNLQLSHIYTERAPSLSQLGAPQLVTSGATIFDITTGQTAVVDIITGGNPDLVAEKQRDWKIGLNYDLPFFRRSNVIVEYYDESSTDVSSSFPALTPTIEAAFPGRVVRDAEGNLVSIDQRPVTYAHQDGRRLRYGFDISDRIAGNEDGERGEERGGGGPPGFGGGRGGGHWGLAAYHTVRFEQSVQIADGTPVLDLLEGESLTATPVARHEVELSGRVFYGGFGARLSGNYLGGASIDGGSDGGTSLDFAPIATFDLRLFADLEQQQGLVEAVPFFKGSRLSLSIDNIFDAQQRVTDANGDVPVNYLPDFIDPAGRFFEVEFRKRF